MALRWEADCCQVDPHETRTEVDPDPLQVNLKAMMEGFDHHGDERPDACLGERC